VEPLQQYLVELPGGRLQALPLAWDTRAKSSGGQRWYHLYGSDEIDANDVLHWTRPAQNWNHMCAECHSTHVEKNYDPSADRFDTTWSELSVGCEACHGGGAEHVARAKTGAPGGLGVSFDERKDVSWTRGPAATAARSKPRTTAKEVEACAFCHSRRETLAQPFEPARPLLDHVSPELLTAPYYAADGVMQDEVFTYGSFQQSKMAAAGVTCSDCHEPHAGTLRAPGNALCNQCHDAQRFDSPAHHHHQSRSQGALCVSCHMPARTYMGVDVRHDHGFRVPRPDLAPHTQSSSACNDCHRDRNAAWAARAIEAWFGPVRKGFQSHAKLFAQARAGTDVSEELRTLAANPALPAIVRATALAELRAFGSEATLRVVASAARDGDALIRRAASSALEAGTPAQIVELGLPLLSDPVRGVRVEAARVLASQKPGLIPASAAPAFERALEEYLATQRLNADRAEAQNNLGVLHVLRAEAQQAEAAYRAAIRIEPAYVPSYVNLADLYRAQARDAEGEALLRAALARAPDSAELSHALGLLLVRGKRYREALPELARAAKLDPKNARFSYVFDAARKAVIGAEP
ncbi:MAG TPA: cytochrome c3 family protein, partial [Polyangiaceae bacterium]|nr:cytochrome c3 family protein [Polyangiaceae bacterium]